MKKLWITVILPFALVCSAAAQNEGDIKAIRQMLDKQVVAWNDGNIEAFMESYWRSDSIMFIGSSVTRGWDATLARYRKSYPDKAAMGKLRFEVVRFKFISADSYLVTGKYFLTRAEDAPKGIFTLLIQKKNNKWVVVYDHTSG